LVTFEELIELQEFYVLEPFGAKRDDLHAAQVAYTVAQVNSTKKLKMSNFILGRK